MSKPNKTVAAARRKMGGFPARPPKPAGEFMAWVFEKAIAGESFKTIEEAREAFAKHKEAA